MKHPLLAMELRTERDAVYVRQRVRQTAALLGMDAKDQTRIATAVSEITRNALKYAGGGRVELELSLAQEVQIFMIRVKDAGGGIPDLDRGSGLGIIGAKKLMDVFQVETSTAGTTVTLGKVIPGEKTISHHEVTRLVAELSRMVPLDPLQEVVEQNRELLRAFEALRVREMELEKLNRELEDTNRGVVALYAELEENTDQLKRANERKTAFLSDMTHEFRTPINSILGLSRILLDQLDGPLNEEQVKQVGFIRKASEGLSDLVNDLLDIAKVEAGKVTIKAAEFKVSNVFSSVRGMLKPFLAENTSVSLVFDDVEHLPPARSDEGKVSQILRNLISNALKFTEHGEIRVSARLASANRIAFEVSDTGIGISLKDQKRLFEEFFQVESPLQARGKGSGLGLPLARKLAGLLGGEILVESEPGKGSRFSVLLPLKYRDRGEVRLPLPRLVRKLDPGRVPLLVLEDDQEMMYEYEKFLKSSRYQVIPVRNLREAREALAEILPVAMIVDILLASENAWEFAAEVKSNQRTRDIPVIVVTMVDNWKKARAMGAEAFHVKPIERGWLLRTLERLTRVASEKALKRAGLT